MLQKCGAEVLIRNRSSPRYPLAMQSDVMSGNASAVMTEEHLLFTIFLAQEIKINN